MQANSRPSPALIVAIVGLIVAVTGVGVAAIPNKTTGTITGCFNTKSGVLRVIDEKKKCAKGEKRIAWNQKGQTGAAGAAGPDGQQGPPGQPGAPGSDAQFNGAPADGDLDGTYPNPEIEPNAVGSPEVALNSLGGADIDEGLLAQVPSAANADTLDLLNGDHLRAQTGSTTQTTECDPNAATYTNCASNTVTLAATGNLVVIAAAEWYGAAGAGADDAGSCGTVLSGTDPGANTIGFGQAGDQHNSALHAGTVAFTALHTSVTPGAKSVGFNCNQTNGDIRISRVRLTVLRLSG